MIDPIGKPEEQYRGRMLRIATQRMSFSDGTEKTFEFAERAPGVRVLVSNGRSVLLTKEWRSESNSWDYRLPGGKVFDSLNEYLAIKEPNNSDLQSFVRLAAQKELREETSISLPIYLFNQLHHSVCGATVIWDLYYYLVETDEQEAKLESITTQEGEYTCPLWVSYKKAEDLCLTGKVQEDRTVAVLLKYLLQVPK